MRRAVLALGAAALLSGCVRTGVPPSAIHAWAEPNLRQYASLIDQQHSDELPRLVAYKGMASLICDADIAERRHEDSVACRCQHAVSDAELKSFCKAFINRYR